ncbi:hypothetical protein [Bradyrhizobium sp. LeoA1S1]
MLKSIGIQEIFLPKYIPDTNQFRSGSVDWSEDANLTIPKSDLDVLNSQNWYGRPSYDAWKIANLHFDLVFIIATEQTFYNATLNFEGAIIYRAYGFDRSMTYSGYLDLLTERRTKEIVNRVGKRFWFGTAYEHLHEIEPSYLASRRLFLPAGLTQPDTSAEWIGSDRRIMFVCPDISRNTYYRNIYNDFCREFQKFDYVIGGQQYDKHDDPRILGFVPSEVHKSNMRNLRVMFYHSTEPRHLHYHPLEAIAAGMPLVYMAGGVLDRLGGLNQPGRCGTIEEARAKIGRVLADDEALIGQIRQSQRTILTHVSADYCRPIWRRSIEKLTKELEAVRKQSERRALLDRFMMQLRNTLPRRKKPVHVEEEQETRKITWREITSSPLGAHALDPDCF